MIVWALWLATAVAGSAALAAAWRRLRALGRAGRSDPPPAVWPRVSLVVPARDEAHNLPRLLASVARLEPAPAEVIVVDDHSRDGTGDLARAAGATVVVPPPLPAGWLGKSWACAAGAAAATGDLLLFTDADTVHGPASLGRAVARLEAERADLVSVVPTHRAEVWWERLQGAFHLLLLLACRAGAPATRGKRRFSIGQYLLFRRDAYRRAGGHEAVRDVIAEDLALAERVVDGGGRFALVAAPGTLEVRMYPEGLAAFLRGWRRSFRDGMRAAGAGGGLELVAAIGWLLGVPLSLAAALALDAGPASAAWAAAYVATALVLVRAQRVVGELPWWGPLAFPAAALAFVGVSAAAAIDHVRNAPVRWRGRTVALPGGGGGGS